MSYIRLICDSENVGKLKKLDLSNPNIGVLTQPLGFYTSGTYRNLFNCNVILPESASSCSNMYQGCTNFNMPVSIGNNIKNCPYMFVNCVNFNSLVDFGEGLTNCSYMFLNCTNFNQHVTIGNNVTICDFMFQGCTNFNSPVTFGNQVINCRSMFENCVNFNKPVIIGNNVVNCSNMFVGCTNLNSPVTALGDSIYCEGMFQDCDIRFPINIFGHFGFMFKNCNVNSDLHLHNDGPIFNNCNVVGNVYLSDYTLNNGREGQPGNLFWDSHVTANVYITNVSGGMHYSYDWSNSKFARCLEFSGNIEFQGGESGVNLSLYCKDGWNFNANVHIGNNVLECGYMFFNCSNFNKPVIIDSATNCYGMFYMCTNFNQPITLPSEVTNTVQMFYNCHNFNQQVIIPSGVTNTAQMFDNCYNFNQPITLPSGVTNCYSMFHNCTNFSQDLYIPDSVGNRYYQLLMGCHYHGTVSFPEGTTTLQTGIIASENTVGATEIYRDTGNMRRVDYEDGYYKWNYIIWDEDD